MDLKQALSHIQAHLAELETAARKLPNQNFADLIKAAGGRLAQASEHPDLEAVGEQLRADLHGNQEQEELKFPAPGVGSDGLPLKPNHPDDMADWQKPFDPTDKPGEAAGL